MALTTLEVLSRVLQCAYDGVDHTGDLEINRVCMVPGEIAWDSCACGQLVLSEQRRFPSTVFPTDEVDHSAECGQNYIVSTVILSLVRCVPVPSDDGEPPSCVDLTTAFTQFHKDMADIRRAVECCLSAMYNSHDLPAYELGAQEVVGPQGGCAGSELTIWLGFLNGCGCG